MNTYYIWDEQGGVTVSQAMEGGFESGFVVRVERNGAMKAVKDLAEMARAKGKKRWLEIHCHGLPGRLLLGADYGVTNQNVVTFGATLRMSLFAGGLIELLACSVAAQKTSSGNPLNNLLKAPKAKVVGYREEYHGAIRQRRNRQYGVYDSKQFPVLYGGQSYPLKDAVKEDPNAFFAPDVESDGLRFCLELASASGCVVRAATQPQGEDGGHDALDSPVGDWEFEVFDFHPDGQIKFLGVSPYRGRVMNSFDTARLPLA